MISPLVRMLAIALLSLAAATNFANAFEKVSFPSRDAGDLVGWLARPAGAGPFPVVIGLHGCAGLYARSGAVGARESDWSERLTSAGYAVLLVDSFGPRGIQALCNERERSLTPAGRARDAFAAIDWLDKQSFAAKQRIALIGWSNGSSTALRVAGASEAKRLRHVIAFYPGCRVILKRGWQAQTDTAIFQGLADDWTPAAPCEELARSGGARFVGFPGAYHDFDHPSLPLRERKAAYSQRPDGLVTIGSDPKARAEAIDAVMAILKRP
ncbi:dienelactone hydrolase family protein [uncultured Bosea sp.]|uniref:dienelactone hydrolase family protein n=1 Tax=uncultured Bosea sp. TaxID=211457 RepID=UPI0025EC71E3|nr:dienelactone hydrolase family protein [uncultured Bosea sp.]